MKDIAEKILARLNEQQKSEGKLPVLLEFYRKLLLAQSGIKKDIVPAAFSLTPDDIRARLAEGRPLLDFDGINLDKGQARHAAWEILGVFNAFPELFDKSPYSLKNPYPSTREAVRAWYYGENTARSDVLFWNIIQATMQPFLEAHAAVVKSVLDTEFMEGWRRGHCPVCGGSPDMGFLEKEVGARWLACPRCSTEWLFQRLQCPFCGTQEQAALSYFLDDQERYRLYVCDKCRCYLKAVDLRRTEGEVLLPLERLQTLHLDAQASERGYHPFWRPAIKAG